jgi:hypothetical protein
VFAEYLKSGVGPAVLLIMCPNPGDDLRAYAYTLGLNDHDFRIIKVPHEAVPAHLNAADIGFLIRDDCVVNRVASPTKLGEYLSCGLPVIVGSVSLLWPSARIDPSCLCLVELDNAAKAAKSVQQFLSAGGHDALYLRQKAVSLAEQTLSNRHEVGKLRKFYEKNVQGNMS